MGPLISRTGSKIIGNGKWEPNNKDDLIFLTELLEAGKIRPVIDKCYPLAEVPEALRHLEDGHALGKVVIKMEHNDET